MAYQKRQYRRKRKGSVPSWLLAVIIVMGVFGFISYRNHAAADPAGELTAPNMVTARGDMWWHNSYAYRQEIIYEKPVNKLLELKLDHATMVLAGQSLPDGADLRIVAQIDDAFELVPMSLSAPNTNSSMLSFDGSKFSSAIYYLYFGNIGGDIPALPVTNSVGLEPGTRQATLGSIQTPVVRLELVKRWNLIQQETAEVQISLHAEVGSITEGTEFYFATEGIDKLRRDPEMGVGQLQEYSLKVSGIKPGVKGLYLVVKSPEGTYRTNTVYFTATAPVYVAWTIDWEGYNVQDWVLLAISNIAARYQMPLTQFFNPRLYIDAQTPEYRRAEITDWLQNRLANSGDELAMHMHMQYDMVRAAGLEPVSSPRWGSGIDGYDVLTSDYSYEEFKQILRWALQVFSDKGLGRPTGYRAGGWFADLDILRAINDSGFEYDSSGRESYVFGAKKQQGHWSLTHTTQPYQPSTTNQNSSEPEPRLRIWEVPNNGNDSYWFGTDELINRFYVNYTKPGEVMDKPKLVTYLSHPDWFDVDQPKLEALFAEINKYNIANDNGPVVFTTISQALGEWTN